MFDRLTRDDCGDDDSPTAQHVVAGCTLAVCATTLDSGGSDVMGMIGLAMSGLAVVILARATFLALRAHADVPTESSA